jgi:hypothetical protein
MLRKFRTKGTVVVLGIVAALAVAGGAIAYFTSTGSGTGNAKVGSASNWTVAVGAYTGGPLYPGAGSENVPFTITNASSGAQELQTTTAALTKDAGGGVYDTTTQAYVDGCQASWFTVTDNTPTPAVDLAGGAQYTSGNATVTMQDSQSNQDSCQGLTPQVTVNAG